MAVPRASGLEGSCRCTAPSTRRGGGRRGGMCFRSVPWVCFGVSAYLHDNSPILVEETGPVVSQNPPRTHSMLLARIVSAPLCLPMRNCRPLRSQRMSAVERTVKWSLQLAAYRIPSHPSSNAWSASPHASHDTSVRLPDKCWKLLCSGALGDSKFGRSCFQGTYDNSRVMSRLGFSRLSVPRFKAITQA